MAIEAVRADLPAVLSEDAGAGEKLAYAAGHALDRLTEIVSRPTEGLDVSERRLIAEAADRVLRLYARVHEAALRRAEENDHLAEYRAAVAEFEKSERRQIEGRRKRAAEGETS